MSQLYQAEVIQDGNAVILDFGFIPEHLRLFMDDGTNPDIVEWFRNMENLATAEYGFLLTGSSGIVTKLSTAATGVIAFDSTLVRQMIPAPNGDGLQGASLPSAFVAGTAQPSARTTTTLGTLTKPSSGNENGLVFECTADNSTYGTEPTWPSVAGQSVTDDNSNTWLARESVIQDIGAKGVQLGASLSQNTDGNRLWALATKPDASRDKGDAGNVVAGNPV